MSDLQLDNFHRIEAASDRTGGQEIHIFATAVGPVYGEPSNDRVYDIALPLATGTLVRCNNPGT